MSIVNYGVSKHYAGSMVSDRCPLGYLFIYSERDDLMLRNAELSQELRTVKKTLEDEKLVLEEDIKGRIEAENIQQQKCDQLQESCDKLREEVHFILYNVIITH